MSLPKGKHIYIEVLNESQAVSMKNSHFHDYYEISYQLEGKRRYFINHTLYDAAPDGLILVNKGDVHMSCPVSDNKNHVRCLISFDDEFLDGLGIQFDREFLIKAFEKKKVYVCDSMQNVFNMLVQKAEENVSSEDIYSQYLLKLIVLEILVHINKLACESDCPSADSITVYESRIQEVCRYICNYYNNPISLEQMANKAQMSNTYFSKKFKKVTGFGFKEYLNNIRIKIATNLLMETQYSIGEIAAFCGYRDSNYFGDAFKHLVGVSPNRYRKEHYIK